MSTPEDNSQKIGQASGGADGLARSARLRPSGGYRRLRSFQVTTIVYDATVSFCERFIDKRSRLVDQMVQAARSGRQNIAEGSRAAATSSQTELRLVNVARASLDELLLDYEDFLRQRGLALWTKDHPEAQRVRNVGRTQQGDSPDGSAYDFWLRHTDSATVANAVICLIHQANYLLDQQISALERDFVQEGGYSEQLAAARIAERRQAQLGRGQAPGGEDRVAPADRADRSDKATTEGVAPACPACGGLMALRTARKGARAGSQFWGCAGYPECRGTRAIGSGGAGLSDGSGGSGKSPRSDGEMPL